MHARKHPGGVASMTRDKGYPDWLVLSARLLAQPTCGQVKIVQNICFGRVPLWLCEDITACCYMYCYFRNILLGKTKSNLGLNHDSWMHNTSGFTGLLTINCLKSWPLANKLLAFYCKINISNKIILYFPLDLVASH